MERAARLKKGHEEQIETLKRTAELDAEERTDASIQRILTQNKTLTDELAIHIEASHAFVCTCALRGILMPTLTWTQCSIVMASSMHADFCLAARVVSRQACQSTDLKSSVARIHGLHDTSLSILASARRLTSSCHCSVF